MIEHKLINLFFFIIIMIRTLFNQTKSKDFKQALYCSTSQNPFKVINQFSEDKEIRNTSSLKVIFGIIIFLIFLS
jgi:hypothetical protein